VANDVVHVDIAKNLIELILDVQHLTEMVLYLGIKLEEILDKKEAGKQPWMLPRLISISSCHSKHIKRFVNSKRI
jgi:hypothetical protein